MIYNLNLLIFKKNLVSLEKSWEIIIIIGHKFMTKMYIL